MSLDAPTTVGDTPVESALDSHRDVRALVRLFQCSLCSLLLRTPVTLPCGNCCCKQCLPQSHFRDHITFPPIASRQYGIICPFGDCQHEHPLEDCSVNVAMSKVMESMNEQVLLFRQSNTSSPVAMEETLQLPPTSMELIESEQNLEKGHTHSAPGGRLHAALSFAESGTLHYTSDISFQSGDEEAGDVITSDSALADTFKALVHRDLECQVCYNLMLDPTTTPCGHTFCRRCLTRILDHSRSCPVCRNGLFLPPSLSRHPSNKYLVDLLKYLCPEQVKARTEAAEVEERGVMEGLNTPLFVCTLSYPGVPMFLHIFEPRYRLMIRRALETNRQFGMVMYNLYNRPQGGLGHTQFLDTGTMLHIEQCQILPDGRSLIECTGVYRFKVRAHGVLDGYMIGNVEKLEDVSLAEEEGTEAHETSVPLHDPNDAMAQIDRMPTATLFQKSTDFISRARDQSARWFSDRVIDSLGDPPEDPATFPYWFAAVLPISEEEKYQVLQTSSTRERLKICAKWVHRIETNRW